MKNAGARIKGYYEKNEEDAKKINELTSEQHGWTPLQVACGYGSMGAVTALLELGAKANTKDNMGMTPVHAAADTDEKGVMPELLKTDEGKECIDAVDAVSLLRGPYTRSAPLPTAYIHAVRHTTHRTDCRPTRAHRMAAPRSTMRPTPTARPSSSRC